MILFIMTVDAIVFVGGLEVGFLNGCLVPDSTTGSVTFDLLLTLRLFLILSPPL